MSLNDALTQGLDALNLPLPESCQHRLLDYLALIHKWNQVYNLTAVRDPENMLALHLLDSLAVIPHLPEGDVVDVGSGAGLPGIPLALALPHINFTLLDSNHKKATFLREAVMQLGLKNTEVVCERVEAYTPTQKFPAVISRAFSDLAEFVRLSRHLCAPGGRLLAMKGLLPYEELSQLPADVKWIETAPLSIPGIENQRHLVALEAL